MGAPEVPPLKNYEKNIIFYYFKNYILKIIIKIMSIFAQVEGLKLRLASTSGRAQTAEQMLLVERERRGEFVAKIGW